MEIKGVYFTNVSASRTVSFKMPKKVQITSNVTLKKVAKTSTPQFGDCFVVDFVFKTEYVPNVAQFLIDGEVYVTGKPVDIAKKTKGEYVLKDKTRFSIMNSISTKCLRKFILMSDEMRLPPPIQFPVFGQCQHEGPCAHQTTKKQVEEKKDGTVERTYIR